MAKFSKKKNKQVKKTRKEIRKEKRKLKKIKRNEYYTKQSQKEEIDGNKKKKSNLVESTNTFDVIAKQQIKAKREKQDLEKKMHKQRNKQLLEANANEDRLIKKLEKQLKLDKKKKSSTISKNFSDDGLDYILEMCDPELRKNAGTAVKSFAENNIEDDFNEDFAVAVGKSHRPEQQQKSRKEASKNLSTDEQNFKNQTDDGQSDFSDVDSILSEYKNSDAESGFSIDENDQSEKFKRKRKRLPAKTNNKSVLNKKQKITDNEDKKLESSTDEENFESDANENSDDESKKSTEWEDIYGRKRDNKGNVIKQSQGKYIPPALRNKINDNSAEKIRLKKQMKGQLNRLTESNLISISQKFENFYSSGTYSRHILNSALCELIDTAIITYLLCPKQTVADHALLVALLHANIDIEIGANFLQHIVEKYNQLLKRPSEIENKELENTVHIISQLYNLKVFHCGLIHEILCKLLENGLSERNVESALLILKTVGHTLRKDDPLSLKNTLLHIQNIIVNAPHDLKQSSRLKFMSDILMAIKNNNFTKIPNYSPEDVEHLRKVLRGAVRKGNYVTELNIALEDLLNVRERGKWWVVGSAWTGKKDTQTNEKNNMYTSDEKNYNTQLLELARKQRMNTDTRRNIFCVLMSAEDYLDAFEKLLHLGLRGQQEREIVHVLMHCCLQEKVYNPYYGILARKLCDYDRKFQIAIQCSVWDKLKDIKNFSSNKITNLAKFLTFLFIEGSLPLATLKVIELSELDKPLLRLLRQTLLGVLLNNDLDALTRVWERSGGNPTFKQGLRLFIHHFLIRGNAIQKLSDSDQELLKNRAKIADKILSVSDKRITL